MSRRVGLWTLLRRPSSRVVIGGGHVQSLVPAAILMVVGVQIWLIGLMGDLLQMNRKMLEVAYRLLRIEAAPEQGRGGPRE